MIFNKSENSKKVQVHEQNKNRSETTCCQRNSVNFFHHPTFEITHFLSFFEFKWKKLSRFCFLLIPLISIVDQDL